MRTLCSSNRAGFEAGAVFLRSGPALQVLFAGLALAVGAFEAQSQTNTTEQVIRFLEARIRNDPDDFTAAEKLGHTYLQSARETGVVGRYSQAERCFRDVLKWTPDSYPARAALAGTLVSQHKFRDAAALAGELTREYPAESAAYGVLGDALYEIGDVSAAVGVYEKLLALEPGIGTYSRMAKVEWSRGNVGSALSNLSQALQFTNSAPETLAWTRVQKGALHFRIGQLAEAETEWTQAERIFPGYFLAVDHLAELRAAQGKFEDAARTFEQLAERTQRPEYWQAVGDVWAAARHAERAKPWHDRALNAYLKDVEAGRVQYFHHLASFYADVREDGAAAEKWARRDLEVRKNIYAWDALAWALFWKKDYAASAEAMNKALALGTKDAQLLAHAGSIFVRAGRISEGRDFMKRAAEANPHYSDFHVHR